MRLNGTGLATVALGEIEDHGVGMELRRNITVYGAGRIMLKLCSDELARRLWGMIAANAGLRVMLQLFEGHTNAFPMRFTDTIIAADQSGE